jgi:hypothetical protein
MVRNVVFYENLFRKRDLAKIFLLLRSIFTWIVFTIFSRLDGVFGWKIKFILVF